MQLTLPLTAASPEPIVLTASRRLAHALRLAHAAQAQAQGLRAWRTPQILPLSTWLREQWVDWRAAENSSNALRLLTSSQTRLLWEQIVAESPHARDLLSTTEAARIAARSWQRLHDYLIDIALLQSYDAAEARALHAWCTQFEAWSDRLHALDESRLTHWAWRTGLTPQQPLRLVGFDTFTPAVNRLLDRWRARGLVEVIESTYAAAQIATAGFSDRDSEIEAAARWAHSQVATGRSRVAVVLDDLAARSEEVRRSFAEVFAPRSRTIEDEPTHAPFVVAAPQPLAHYSIVDAALSLLELMKGHADSHLAGRLFRSPFIAQAMEERDARAIADARLRQEQREQWDIYELERFSALAGCTALALAARNAAQLHRVLPARAPASTWAQHFHALLQSLGWPGSRVLSSVEQQTVMKFQAVLTDLGSLDALLGPITLAQAHRELRKLANDTAFEAETAAALVTIIDATTVAGMQFDAIWVAGLDASRFPKPTQPDPLIPLALQRKAGVPEASPETSYALSHARLARLTRSARTIVLSWPQRDGDAQLQMSPLIASFPRSTDASDLAGGDLRFLVFAARPALQVLQDDWAPALANTSAKGGARILELQSLCPFRAQATLRLSAEPLTHASAGFDARHRGIFIHRLLEEFWVETKDQATLLAHDEVSLRTRLTAIAEGLAARWLPPNTRARARLAQLEIQSAVQRAGELLDIDRARPPFRVRRTEGEERVSMAGLTIRLQPDRIDEVEGGSFLIDYKLGDAHTPRKWLDRKPGRPEQPQLPLYALGQADQLAGLAFATLAPGSIEYRGWHRGMHIAPGVVQFPNEVRRLADMPDNWPALLEHWREVLHGLADQFVSGAAEVNPLPQACTYCHLSTFCRIHERDTNAMAEEGDSDE